MHKKTIKVIHKGETFYIPQGYYVVKSGKFRAGDKAYSWSTNAFIDMKYAIGEPTKGHSCVIRKVKAKPGPKPTGFYAMSKGAQDTVVAMIGYCLVTDKLLGMDGGRTKTGKPKAIRRELTEFLAGYIGDLDDPMPGL